MQVKVVKFGGSSLADAEHFKQVASIIHADPARRYVVPSAPGKRFKDDTKVTDMLYRCYNMIRNHENIDEYYTKGTVSYTALNSARIMGFSKIILVRLIFVLAISPILTISFLVLPAATGGV